MKRMIILVLLLLTACSSHVQQPFPRHRPVARGQAPPPAQTPTIVACTSSGEGQLNLKHLPEFDQRATTAIAVELSHLQPGEKLTLILDAQTALQRQTREFQPVEPAAEDERFSYVEYLSTLPGTRSTQWTVKVVHARGVLCSAVTVPVAAQP